MASLSAGAGSAAVTFETLLARSAALPYKFPTEHNLLRAFAGDESRRARIVEFAATTRPIVLARMVPLLRRFLDVKLRFGSPVERAIYAGMDENGLIDRLITKRPLVFMNSFDQFKLKSGFDGAGSEYFDRIGSRAEVTQNSSEMRLETLMSYDEIGLAALLSVSTPTFFINSGGRNNFGSRAAPGTFVESGIVIGQVGARFERPSRMEWRHCIVDSLQNTVANGYGPALGDSANNDNATTTADSNRYGVLTTATASGASKHESSAAQHDRQMLQAWAEFYGLSHFPTYAEAAADTSGRFVTYRGLKRNNAFLDTLAYELRMNVAAETLLLEANERASAGSKRAVCHVVGLGLGVWQIDSAQSQIYVDCYGKAIRKMRGKLGAVKAIYFSWIRGVASCDGATDGEVIDGITIRFGKRNPNDADEFAAGSDSLLLTQYAWDGNSYPGNEYWLGSLAASGDPAAACCCLIPELQNPDVNVEQLCGANTRKLD